jgi:hypothetical protein
MPWPAGTSQVAALTTDQIGAMHRPGCRPEHQCDRQRPDHRPGGGAVVQPAATLSTAQFGALSTNNVAAIETADIVGLKTNVIAALKTAQLAALTTDQLSNLSTGQLPP